MILRHDPRNERARALRQALEPLLDQEALPEELCVCLGGDGFLLSTIGEEGPERIYLGLNCGRLGFMLNDVASSEEVATLLNAGAWAPRVVHRLRVIGEDDEGGVMEAVAVNDVYLERSTGQTAHLQVSVDGVDVVDRLVCDGLILSTALGSTAYALAAGGVACRLDLNLMQLVPISPHRPRLPAIALPRSSVVEVEVLDGHRRPVRAVSDGRNATLVKRVRVEDANSDVRLAFFEGHNPTATLIRKLLHPW